MMRRIAAVVIALHGVVHLIGLAVPWQIATVEGFAYRTTVLGGALDVGDAGARILGLVWLALAVGFVVAALGVWRGDPRAIGLTVVLAVVSLLVCLAGLPETAAGVAVDAVILAILAFGASRDRVSVAH